MDRKKRQFLSQLGILTVGAAVIPFSGHAQGAINDQPPRRHGDPTKRWGMVIDLRKCIGCQACTVACSIDNQMPLGQFRTHVHQYEVADPDEPNKVASVMLPRLCNHCDNPACIPVCPVQATYQQKDGIVVVDSERCVGCAYCVQACPYDARFINKETNTAEKCTFCTHRIQAGLLPACVESCVGGARIIGNLNDPNSQVNQIINANIDDIKVLKPEAGTQPKVFYIGLDEAFESHIKGQSAIWTIRNDLGEEIAS